MPSSLPASSVGFTPQFNMITADTLSISGGTFTQNNNPVGDPLDRLKRVPSAGIQALDEDGCMEGTRVSLLNDLRQWSMDITAPPIFWLDGMAGTGKSAIARSFCRFLHENHQLGGSFFCLRGHESRANVKRLLPTLAWFLARQDLQYQTTLSDILRDNPDVADYNIKQQVTFLLEMPLRRVVVTQTTRTPLVLAIDALDECADAEEVKQLLNRLLSVADGLPLKFFLTSRPERHIVTHFEASHSGVRRILRLHDIEKDLVEADILLYLNNRLTDVRCSSRSPSMFPLRWPLPRDIHVLTQLSGKLFIYAFTAVKFIAAKNHVKRLETLTRLSVDICQPFHGPLDKMYSLVLSAALDPNECTWEEICMTKRILGTIIAIREPLHLSDLAKLLVVAPDDIWENTDRIRAVVNVPSSGEDGVVSTFHASFVDFLTTSGRVPENMRVTLSTAHQDLAHGCLKIMNSGLHFNIADCKTSHLFNSEQTLATIPPPLKYASLHWAHHMCAADDAASLLPRLENVLFEKFLYWLEVLSVSGTASRASSIISRASTLEATTGSMTESLVTFLYDANHFAVAFREVIESSVPHIYLSALASTPKTSKIAKLFLPKYPYLMRITPRGIQPVRTPLLELRGHTSCVDTVGFSPDGAHIVSGSWDFSIRIWDARTGEEVMKPLKGHTGSVASVAFSPDGTHIVSGSYDKTIRIWNVRMGEEVMKLLDGHSNRVVSVGFSPNGAHIVSGSGDYIKIWDAGTGEVIKLLKGHTNRVASVGFSPDGTHIVSGSWDTTIGVWDARTGEEVMKPLKGHTGGITSIRFSPDGTHIVSGALDKTIRIWDARTGEKVMQLKGHTGAVTSVGFSPDGTHIVSGSLDKTIRIWDLGTGKKVIQPLQGHNDRVASVGFSPDGTHITSGSWDTTIRIWDARTGEEAMKFLKAHTDTVRSVGFSPDGAHIVSGSRDKSIRMWDTRTGEEVMWPLMGHTDIVASVRFSPDGAYIVSGSWDETIRIWDARTGEEVMEPLSGHTDAVTSVDFSPDGTHIVSGSLDETIRIWDASTGEEVMKPLKGHNNRVSSVGFSTDGAHIVSGSWDTTIRIWDTRTGKVIKLLKGHTDGVTSVGFFPDGAHIVSGSWDKSIRLWDARTGEEIMKLLDGHSNRVVLSVGFSPDGVHIVTSSGNTIYIMDMRTGEVMKLLEGHTDTVASVAFSPDGTHVVSSSWDMTIRIWDVRTGEVVVEPPIENINFMSDGWMRGSSGELILWVLPQWRGFTQWSRGTLIIGQTWLVQVQIDPQDYVHGLEWMRCLSVEEFEFISK